MTTGLSFNGTSTTNSYVQQIATMAVVSATDTAFVQILPSMITYAENRIYRDLDFLFSSVANSSYTVPNGTRTISIPAGTNFAGSTPYGGGVLVVAEQINLLTPAGSTNPEACIRVPLIPTTKEFLDAVYGSAALIGQPQYFCPFDDYTFLVGPYANATYTVEIIGTFRPYSLGPGTTSDPVYPAYPNGNNTVTTTFISLYLPDLFIMASMIYIAAYQRNFSSALGNDPQMPITYETQYQALLKSAMEEESRKKFEAAAWSSQGTSKFATPTRG